MPAADASGILQDARERGLNVLDEPSAKRLLGLFGIASPRGCVLRSSKDLGALGTLQAPFVLKTVSPQIVHKSDVGAVRLGLRDSAAVGAAIDELDAALRATSIEVPAWLVEEMAPGGVECVVGGMHDAEFGPMVMVGLGGVFVEVMRDVSFRICPVSREDAVQMIDELRGAPLLRGARGRLPVSVERLVDTLLAIGGERGVLLHFQDEIAEIDINPLAVTVQGALALDARIVLVAQGRAA